MAYHYQNSQKPEDVLRRAEEYVSVGKKNSALKLIFDLLSNRRGRTWSQAHEKVMIRYLELCTDVKNSRYAKEGLHQFRSMSLTQAPSSLEKVIRYFLTSTSKLTEDAAAECNLRTVTREIEDLENAVSPEAILLEVVTSDKTRDRTEREVLVPWLKFLWESFRIVLDLLRNQSRLEELYHSIAKSAFEFCEKYNRTTEFRRLTDLLRGHLNPKYPKPDQEILNTPESMSAHLETRFEQLRVASKLRLWNEGFRTIEDIHAIMNQAGLKISSSLLGSYYEKLTHLFLVSENFLFHAYAYKKFFILTRDKKRSIDQDALSLLGSKVLLAALSIPLRSNKAGRTLSEEAIQLDKNQRMALLLGFDIDPKRNALLKELATEKIGEIAIPRIQQLYLILESNTYDSAESFVNELAPCLKSLYDNPEFSHYVKAVQTLVIIRLVSLLSSVTTSLCLDIFEGYVTKLNIGLSNAETAIVKCVQSRQISNLRVSIDHGRKRLNFGQDILESKESKLFLKHLVHKLRKELVNLKVVDPTMEEKTSLLEEKVRRERVADHHAMLARKKMAEERKSELLDKEKEKKQLLTTRFIERQRQASLKEKQRLELEKERRQKEQEEKARNAESIENLKQILTNAGESIDEKHLEKLTENEQAELIKNVKEKLQAQAKEEANKRTRAWKRMEALVYAKREIQKDNLGKLVDEVVHQTMIKTRKRWELSIKEAKKRHEQLVSDKRRFSRIAEHVKTSFAPFAEQWEQVAANEKRKKIIKLKRQRCLEKLEDARAKLQAAKEEEKRRIEEQARLEELERERQESAAAREEQFNVRPSAPAQSGWRRAEVEKPSPRPVFRREAPPVEPPSQPKKDTYSYRPKAPPTTNPWSGNHSSRFQNANPPVEEGAEDKFMRRNFDPAVASRPTFRGKDQVNTRSSMPTRAWQSNKPAQSDSKLVRPWLRNNNEDNDANQQSDNANKDNSNSWRKV